MRASLPCGEVPGGAGWGLVPSPQHSGGGRLMQEPRQRWTKSLWGLGKAGRGEGAKKGLALSPQWPLIMTYWGDREGKPQNPKTRGLSLPVLAGRLDKPTSLCQRRGEGGGRGQQTHPCPSWGGFLSHEGHAPASCSSWIKPCPWGPHGNMSTKDQA